MGCGFSYTVYSLVGMQFDKNPILPGIPDNKGFDISNFQYCAF